MICEGSEGSVGDVDGALLSGSYRGDRVGGAVARQLVEERGGCDEGRCQVKMKIVVLGKQECTRRICLQAHKHMGGTISP